MLKQLKQESIAGKYSYIISWQLYSWRIQWYLDILYV